MSDTDWRPGRLLWVLALALCGSALHAHSGSGVDPESVVVHVIPRPEGAAGQLREKQKQIPLPPVRTAPGSLKPRTRPSPAARPRSTTTVAQHQALLSQSTAATRSLPSNSRLLLLDKFTFGVPSAVKDKAGKGPGPTVLDLLEGLRADASLTREEILRVSTSVFQDQNPASGIFYFVPQTYALSFSPLEGYGMRMLYSAVQPGEPGEVVTAARLDAGVSTREIELAATLLRAYQARHPETKFVELRPLPIERPPDVSLGGDLQHQYDIPAEKIAVSAISDALGEIEVSWVTDTVTKENIQLALTEEVGINGSLALSPAGGGVPPQSVPVRVRLADAATLGRIEWQRNQAWRNETPYPVRAQYLHALLFEKNVPVVYSWSLGDTTVPPRARLELQPITVPSWLDARAARMWIEYTPVEKCEPCDQAVIAAITGGVTSLGASQITLRTITPLADLGAYEIAARVRSRYFDPSSRQTQTKALPLTADNQDFTLGPIYLVNRQAGQSIPGDPLFELTLDVSMPDGTLRRGSRWMPADGLRVLIGTVQVEKATGPLPKAPKP